MYCQNCGAENSNQARFCRSCGSSVQEGAPPAAPPAVPPPPPTGPVPVPPRAATGSPLVGALIALAVVLLVVAAGALFYAYRQHQAASTAQAAATPAGADQPAPTPDAGTEPAADEAGGTPPATPPVSADDPVAEATVVLENYLAADLGHDGKEMAKYLGGQAAARFRPEVQGQEDLTVHSKVVSGHTVRDDNTIDFDVEVKWSPSDSEEVKTDTEQYVLKRTDKGWRIFSTPAYPG